MFQINRRIRFVISALVAFTVAALLSTVALAGAPKGSETKGRNYFRGSCKDCHVKGAKGGEVTPMTKTQAQWRAYFAKAQHSGGTEPLTKVMSEAQLLDVQTYLINHAADSPQPETCGK